MNRLHPVLIAVLFVSHCATVPKSGSDYIELERTVCFGSCPDYTVTVYSNGRYVFRGGGVVLKEKSAKGRISPADAASIFQAADSIDFINLPDNIDELCVGMVTDGPQVTISLVDSAHMKTVREQACDIYEDSQMEYFEERAAMGFITQQELDSMIVRSRKAELLMGHFHSLANQIDSLANSDILIDRMRKDK